MLKAALLNVEHLREFSYLVLLLAYAKSRECHTGVPPYVLLVLERATMLRSRVPHLSTHQRQVEGGMAEKT